MTSGDRLLTPRRAQSPVLLVVDDEQAILQVVQRLAEDAGFEVMACASGLTAMELLRRRPADLAMVDLRMPNINGLDVLKNIRAHVPLCDVILMTGYAGVESAVEAIKFGARDYLTKPFDLARLSALLRSVREEAERRRLLIALESEVAERLEFCGLIGRSPAMQELFSLIRRLAPHVRTALITGETGTGKELIAQAVHNCGPRTGKRFVTLNCAAVVETLFESELFGHTRGAFTGATETKPGLFDAADGGTLFLDEIGELPLSLQAKLLRVIETGEISRIGAVQSRSVDVCVLAATNRDLHQEIANGRFRRDLLYRLNMVEIALPPLRARREDIPYLTAAFIKAAAKRYGKQITGVAPSAERLLFEAPWDGNVRELRNVIERACLLAESTLITERDMADRMTIVAEGGARETHWPGPSGSGGREPAPPPSSDGGRDEIVRILLQSGGNKRLAAERLGLTRRALYRRLERYGLGDYIVRREPPFGGRTSFVTPQPASHARLPMPTAGGGGDV
jgi:DNA-binding NtrC family response regulator